MMRRTICKAGGSLGVLGIRREDKNVWERRVPLTPTQVGSLLERGKVKKVIVQPSSIRCFDNQAYTEAGAVINEDLSEANTIVAVKEVPAELLIPDRTYMFFSHTIKAQPYNMPLLDTMLEKNVRLLDYERIVGPDGRLVKFGPYAGYAGVLDTLHALGLALLTRGFATPFLALSLSKEYRTLANARADLRIVGDLIRERGLPEEICPMTFAVTGSGSVSQAAQQFLHLLPCKYVDVEELPGIWNKKVKDRHNIYVVVVRAKDMVVPKDPSKHFDKKEYYKSPQLYEPVFHKTVAPYTRVLINGMYWEPRFPRLLTTKQAADLYHHGNFPLLCLGDITCDVGGSVEFFVKATTIQNPLYVFDVQKETDMDIQHFNGDGVIVLGVDHLPAEFPQEASRDFGQGLLPLVEKVVQSNMDEDLAQQEKALGKELFNSVITHKGKLTPNFEYISALRAQRTTSKKKKKVLVIGAGMTSGPCVEFLMQDPKNDVTLVDANQKSLDHIISNFGKGAPSLGEDNSGLRCVKTNAGTMDNFMRSIIKDNDVIVSLLPATMHAPVAQVAIEYGKNMVTASYVSDDMLKLDEQAKQRGVTIVNEMGLDPGIDIMTTARMFDRIRKDGGKITKYVSLCGALVQPENSDCPMGYKFSWSPRGVLTAITRPTRFLAGGKWFDVPGKHLYHLIQPLSGFKGLDLHWVPNGNAEKYVHSYGLEGPEVEAIVRGTLRYSSYAPIAVALNACGLLDAEKPMEELALWNPSFISWESLIRKLIGSSGGELVNELAAFLTSRLSAARAEVQGTEAFKALQTQLNLNAGPSNGSGVPLQVEVSQIIHGFSQLGLLASDIMVPKTDSGLVIDSLCTQMQPRMRYKSHERDFVMMIHKVTAVFPAQNKTRTYTATLALRGYDKINTATAVTVGVPVAATAQMLLDNALQGKPGLLIPTDPDVYTSVLGTLEKRGIVMTEEVHEH